MGAYLITRSTGTGLDALMLVDDESYARIGDRDPCVLELDKVSAKLGIAHLPILALRHFMVVYASPEDISEVLRLMRDNKHNDAFAYACRGFKNLPTDRYFEPTTISNPKGTA